jgi:hypothetical protein
MNATYWLLKYYEDQSSMVNQEPSGLHEEGMWFLNFHLQQFSIYNLGQKLKNRSIVWFEETHEIVIGCSL